MLIIKLNYSSVGIPKTKDIVIIIIGFIYQHQNKKQNLDSLEDFEVSTTQIPSFTIVPAPHVGS